MASDDIKPLLSDRDIDDIILTGSHRNAAGGIYATSVYAFAKEVAIAAIQADREIRAGHVALLKGSMAQAERENDELRAALAQAQSSGQAAPSDAEIIADMEARGWKHLDDEERADIIQFARALLSRYGQAPAASAEPVAWLDPDTADVIHQQRKYDWERFFGEGGKRKAETYTVPLGRIAAPVAAQAPMSDEAIVAEALLFADSSYYGTDLVKRLHFTREGITAFVRSVGGPRAPAANGDAPFLQETDQHALHRFIETTEDDESYDIGKDTVKRLAQLGVVSNHGFGRYGVTAFGYWAHERFWHQNPPLPLRTNSDRDKEARAGVQRTTGSEPVAASSNQATIADYEEVLADHRRLVRQLDVALNGEDGAAKQASLCDIVGQVVSEGIKADDAPDAARWRAYRSQWFNVGLIDANTPIGNAMRALSMAGDQHTVDVAADMLVAAIAAGSPLREGGEG